MHLQKKKETYRAVRFYTFNVLLLNDLTQKYVINAGVNGCVNKCNVRKPKIF